VKVLIDTGIEAKGEILHGPYLGVNLDNQVLIGDRYFLTGWTIPISHSCIAEKAELSRRTVVDKMNILVEAGVIQKRKAGKCYQ
jgi:CRP-like cAMP-binding protein